MTDKQNNKEQIATMSCDELKKLFLHFMKDSSDDYCIKCAYCETTKCARGVWSVNDEGDFESEYPERYATEPCIEGIYEQYKANQK